MRASSLQAGLRAGRTNIELCGHTIPADKVRPRVAFAQRMDSAAHRIDFYLAVMIKSGTLREFTRMSNVGGWKPPQTAKPS